MGLMGVGQQFMCVSLCVRAYVCVLENYKKNKALRRRKQVSGTLNGPDVLSEVIQGSFLDIFFDFTELQILLGTVSIANRF